MISLLDIVTLLIFIPVQLRVAVLLLRYFKRTAARTAVKIVIAAVALGWMADFIPAVRGPSAGGVVVLGLRTFCLAYCIIATVFLVLRGIVRVTDKLLGPAEFHPVRRRLLQTAGHLTVGAPFAAFAYAALIERTDFQVKEIDLPVPGLPDDLDGLRILHLSDIHLSPFLSESQLARAIDASNELRPHLAAVTGDLISGHDDPLDACIRQLARLKADAGIIGCLGNHEEFAGLQNYCAAAGARAGIPFLRGAALPFRFGKATLNVAGVDYQPLNRKADYLTGAEKLVVPGQTNLLLSHNPDVFPVAARQGYNLMLAGHTHGGQVSVEILDQAINPARFFTPFVYGLYRQGPAAAYVTRGIGTIGIPARFGAPPEISLLRLRKA